jgi:hypothetical protein
MASRRVGLVDGRRRGARALGILATGVLAIGAGGCGSSVTTTSGAVRAAAVSGSVQVTSASCSSSSASPGSSASGSCTFVLSDGRRFSCSPAFERRSRLSVSTLEHAKSCRRLSTLAIPAPARRIFTAIEKARTCLIARGRRVTGGPAFPPNPTAPMGLVGELVVVNGAAPTFIAFYSNPSEAQQLEPEIVHNAKRLGAQLERHGAVTVLWSRPPTSQLRNRLEACAFS